MSETDLYERRRNIKEILSKGKIKIFFLLLINLIDSNLFKIIIQDIRLWTLIYHTYTVWFQLYDILEKRKTAEIVKRIVISRNCGMGRDK